MSKAEEIERDYRKRMKEQRRLVKYKEKFGIKPASLDSMEDDFNREKIIKAKSMNPDKLKKNKKRPNKRLKKKLKKKECFYKSKEWRELRYKALKKYGRQCLCCGAKPPNVTLHVDHIKPRSKYPELELDIDNLQILCEDCNLGKSNTDSIDYRP